MQLIMEYALHASVMDIVRTAIGIQVNVIAQLKESTDITVRSVMSRITTLETLKRMVDLVITT